MRYKAQYLGNGKYNLIDNNETVGIVGADTISRIIETGEIIDGLVIDTDKISTVQGIAIIQVKENDKFVCEVGNRLDKLYIIGNNDAYQIAVKQCKANELVILGNLWVLIGYGQTSKSTFNKIRTKGNVRLKLHDTDVDSITMSGGAAFFGAINVRINDLHLNCEKIHFDILDSSFKTALLEGKKVGISLITWDNYGGKLEVKADELSVSNLLTSYELIGCTPSDNLVEYNRNTTIINGSIALSQIKVLNNIKLTDRGLLQINSNDFVEVNKLYFGSTVGGINVFEGSKLYIKDNIIVGKKLELKAGERLRLISKTCKIIVDFGSEAHKYLRANNIEYELKDGIPESVDKMDRKLSLLGSNTYKKIYDTLSNKDKYNIGGLIKYDVNNDWGCGYIIDKDVKDKYNGEIYEAEKEFLELIKNIKDIKNVVYGQNFECFRREWDVCVSETGYGRAIIKTQNIHVEYTKDDKIKKEEIMVVKLGQYILKAIYLENMEFTINKISMRSIECNKAIGLISEIDMRMMRAFIDGIYEDKGYFDKVGRLAADAIFWSAEYKIADFKNNLVAFPTENSNMYTFKSKNKYTEVPNECGKYRNIEYTVEDLSNSIEDRYNSSLIKKVLEDGYERDREHKVTELLELSERYGNNSDITAEFVRDILNTVFFSKVAARKEPTKYIDKHKIDLRNGIYITEITIPLRKENNNLYMSEIGYIYKLEKGNNIVYFKSEKRLIDILKILRHMKICRDSNNKELTMIDRVYALNICVSGKTGKMYLTFGDDKIKMMKLRDLKRAMQFITVIRKEENRIGGSTLLDGLSHNKYAVLKTIGQDEVDKDTYFIIKECMAI